MPLASIKSWLKAKLAYEPLAVTKAIYELLNKVRVAGLPYCPPYEGDLLYSLITTNGYRVCLETGFLTGSTALYMMHATAVTGGHITSIGLDNDETVKAAQTLIETAGFRSHHTLIRQNSNLALPNLLLSGRQFDFIFMDGWKTLDHVAFEIYLFNQILKVGGAIVFDDAYMPSVSSAINLLMSHYQYEEVDYARHHQPWTLRLFQILTRRSITRPYRAFVKKFDVAEQPAFRDWNFFRKI